MEKFTTIIQPASRLSPGFRELWQYRELFYFFTWRDIKIKYKQTWLGIGWALVQPLAMMVIFTFLFARTWHIDSTPLKYPVFVMAGLICWNLFNQSVSQAGESMLRHAGIISKVYFPRLIIPGSVVLAALFDFLMAFIIFIVLCLFFGQALPLVFWLYLPVAIILLVLAALGAGTLLATLTIRYRDFRYIAPFLLQVIFFTSQIIYPLQAINDIRIQYVLALNPLNGVIELFRGSLGGNQPDLTIAGISFAAALLSLITGLYIFKKTESRFADLA
ncbi:MAG: ABC transporter permease [Bacteroidetes bacterium]|nr:ABC transporter permease [Bacteroidota bacterium]